MAYLVEISRVLVLLALVMCSQAQGPATKFTFINNCPTDIALYRDSSLATNVPKGTSSSCDEPLRASYVYTDAHGGSADQNGPSTKFTTYWAENDPQYLYYIVKNTTIFNTGMRIEPSHPEVDGFCKTITCNQANCKTAIEKPTESKNFPAPSPSIPTEVPLPPYFSCPFDDVSFTVTFCPSGKFPAPAGLFGHNPSSL